MTATTNTLLKGWPDTRIITGKRGQFLGYNIEGRYFSPLGRKLLKPLSGLAWAGAAVAALAVAGDVPEEDALSVMAIWGAILGGLAQWLVIAVLRSRFELEIRPDVIRTRKRGPWRNFDTGACEFALFAHERAVMEEAREQDRTRQFQQGEDVSMPGRWYRSAASVSLIAAGQRVDIAHIFDRKGEPQKPRKAVTLTMRLNACLHDVRSRQAGYQSEAGGLRFEGR